MALNNVTFTNTAGGLGRLPENEDHVSAILIDVTTPSAWKGEIGKQYRSVEEAEADGITEGSASYGILHYQIKEYFRLAGSSLLFVVNTSDENYSQETFFAFTKGRVRQIYVASNKTYAQLAAHVGELKQFANYLDGKHSPVVIVTDVADDAKAVDTSLPDLRALQAPQIAVLIAGSGIGNGGKLATSLGKKYIPAGGTVLGCLSRAKVHENIGWVQNFNLTSGAELLTSVLSDGNDVALVTDTVLNDLNDKGYMFFRRHQGISGMYVNDTFTATASTDDLYSIENNRTLNKAKREIRAALLPDLLSPLTVDDEGRLAPDTIKYFENKVSNQLIAMQNAGELSSYDVFIDPEQNVLSTGKLIIKVRIVPRGVARQIEVNIGFTTKIA